MENIVEKIDNLLIGEDEAADKLARWANTFAKNHGGKTPDDKGWFDLCVEHMEGKIDDAPAYCARVRDAVKGSTYWRGKGKSEKEAKADVKKHQNYPKGEVGEK
jgi:hypothetical protein